MPALENGKTRDEWFKRFLEAIMKTGHERLRGYKKTQAPEERLRCRQK
jgi:hypothetical protein